MMVQGQHAYGLLEEAIGYTFNDVSFCETALTHKSWLNESPDKSRQDNERLEFLGDAVLALTVGHLLMVKFPKRNEGELSKTRAVLVNESGLARVAEALGLGQWVFLGRGEEDAGGRKKPSILSDVLEAILGAVFLDGGFSAVSTVVDRLFGARLASAEQLMRRDYKSRLQELSQAQLHLPPIYELVGESGPAHARQFEVRIRIGERQFESASGTSKKEAQQNAAEKALAQLEGRVEATTR